METEADFPTIEDFCDRPWEGAIAESAKNTCTDYAGRFQALALAEPEGTRRKMVWLYLARICQLRLRMDSPGQPFGPWLDQITDQEVALAGKLSPEISDAELRARMADIAWVRRKGKGAFSLAICAVKSYVESARILEDPRYWTDGMDRVNRADALASRLNNRELVDLVLAYAEEVVSRYDGEDPNFLSVRMMELLQQHRRGEYSRYAALAGKLAERAEGEEMFEKARHCWVLKQCWHGLDDDPKEARDAALAAAETYVKDARSRIGHGYISRYGVASGLLMQAIEAYRQIPETRGILEQIRKELLGYQELSVDELQPLETEPPDVSKLIEHAESIVSGLGLRDALFSLAVITEPTDAAAARGRTERIWKEGGFSFHSLLSKTLVNALGRVVARTPSLDSSDPAEVEEAILAQTYEDSHRLWSLKAQGLIEPAMLKLNSEHAVGVRDFWELVAHNPFVPPGREGIYAKGLHSGLMGDFLIAGHLLIPQLENSIRHLLYRMGLPASGLTSAGIQDERGLTQTLKDPEFVEPLERLVGKDMMFDLRGVLIDRHGANLRNEMAHGLLNTRGFNNYMFCYLWWLVLRLCFHFVTGQHKMLIDEAEPPSSG
jgi:Domain of unknown function (DUF4209)